MRARPFARSYNTERALRILALAYYAEDQTEASREAIRKLLKLNDDYRADAETDPQFFINEVRRVRPQWYERRWVQAGLGFGAAAFGYLAYEAFIGDETGEPRLPPLAQPPSLPAPPGGN